MGADRKGPLAAFVVIAIIAAILLVTSVRSQAEPIIVASPSGVTSPGVWASVGDDLQQVVQAGATLVRRSASDPSQENDPSATLDSVATTSSGSTSIGPGERALHVATHRVPHRATHRATHHRANHAVPHLAAPATAPVTALAPAVSSTTPGHGRHLGWAGGAGHGHGRHLGWTKHGS